MLQIENPPAKGKKKAVPYDPRDLIILTDRKREYAKVNRQLLSGVVETDKVKMPYEAMWECVRIEDVYDLSDFLFELEDDLHTTVIRGQPIDP